MGLLVVQHHDIQLVNNSEALSIPQSSSLTKEQVLTDFADIFKGLGNRKFEEEINRLISVCVLEKVEEQTKWVSSAVATAKSNGKVRACSDPRPLNEALRRSHYPLPVIDDILPELGKARVFFKADLKDGFL